MADDLDALLTTLVERARVWTQREWAETPTAGGRSRVDVLTALADDLARVDAELERPGLTTALPPAPYPAALADRLAVLAADALRASSSQAGSEAELRALLLTAAGELGLSTPA